MADWVVRAGVANASDLQKAYTFDRRAKVYGFSVQFAPGLAWQDLARSGKFPHTMICYGSVMQIELCWKPG